MKWRQTQTVKIKKKHQKAISKQDWNTCRGNKTEGKDTHRLYRQGEGG